MNESLHWENLKKETMFFFDQKLYGDFYSILREKYELFFYNFLHLISMLDVFDKDFKINGTVRYTKIGRCHLQTSKQMSKFLRGKYENHMME